MKRLVGGAGTLAAAGLLVGCSLLGGSLEGKWKRSTTKEGKEVSEYIEFLKNGDLIFSAGILNINGKWEKLEANKVRLVIQAFGLGVGQICTYAVSGSTLQLSDCDAPGEFERVR